MHKYTIKKGVRNYQPSSIDKEDIFVEKGLLGLKPERFLCPYCGEWHDWNSYHKLGDYDFQTIFNCPNIPSNSYRGCYIIYSYGDSLNYSTEKICERAKQVMSGEIPIDCIIEHSDKPIVTFSVPFTADSPVGSTICRTCEYVDHCNCVKLGDEGNNLDMTITFGFEFEQSEYEKFAKAGKLMCKARELQEREHALKSNEQSLQERENALKDKEQSLQERESALRTGELEQQQRQAEQSTQQEIKEDTTMANNIFNMNMEFGPNKDENIASTLMGVAVKNGDSWRIYDKKTKQITDIGDMQLGNLPIFILPTTKLSEGDLIKDAGEYYFVMKVAAGSTQTLCAKTGEMKTVIPIKNVLGFSCYSKVIAFSDSINMGGDFDVEKLAIMSTMCGQPSQNNNQMNQLLPLMLFKDKLGDDDDMMKMMLMSSMMSAPTEDGDQNATMNQLLPLMLFKDKLGGDDDMMKMMLMSSMMGGNMAGNNNPVMSYLMLDMFMGKKKDEKAQQPAQTPPPQNPAE